MMTNINITLDLSNLFRFFAINNEEVETRAKKNENEICGFWLDTSELVFLHNFANDPLNEFTFSPTNWEMIGEDLKTRKRIKGIFHSHPSEEHSNVLSFADIVMAKETGLDIACYSNFANSWDFFSVDIPHPYPLKLVETYKIGEQHNCSSLEFFSNLDYSLGRCDCYSLVRDYYRVFANVTLKDFPRSFEDVEKLSGWNRFILNYGDCGFYSVSKPQHLDIVLMNMQHSKFPNHIGVLVSTDSELMVLHQPGGTHRSTSTPYRTLSPLVTKFLRHYRAPEY